MRRILGLIQITLHTYVSFLKMRKETLHLKIENLTNDDQFVKYL